MKLWRFGLAAQALLYTVGGVLHFTRTTWYLGIMPDHYADPKALVLWSGAAELAGGAGLLLRPVRPVAAVGLATMLVVFLDVHVFMLRHPERFPGIPLWALWARLPLQAVLIGLALQYARVPDAPRKPS